MIKQDLQQILTNKKGNINSRVVQLIEQGKNDVLAYEILFHTSHIQTSSLRQRIWHIINDVPNVPLCKCGNQRQFNYVNGGYMMYCSKQCADQDADRIDKIHYTKTKRYGDDYTDIIIEKSKVTNQERYGVEFPLQNKQIHNQATKTQQQLYGGYGFQSLILRQKANGKI